MIVYVTIQGNDEMRSGDAKLAFTYYRACTLKSAHEPVYWLNLAAACLKLNMLGLDAFIASALLTLNPNVI